MATYINPEAIKDSSLPIEKIDNVALDLADKVNALDDSNKALFLNKINAMPATPSGDPMHWAYVAAGAEYNDTGADIVKETPWADLADDDADKTVVHKAGYWYLNGLGDITTDEMREIYSFIGHTRVPYPTGRFYFTDLPIRTNFYMNLDRMIEVNGEYLLIMSKIEVVGLGKIYFNSYFTQFMNFSGANHVLGEIKTTAKDAASFANLYHLKTIKLKIQNSFSFWLASNLTTKSVLYMINNEFATSPITIKLHKTVYDRCMANAEILAALETHTNVSLASA